MSARELSDEERQQAIAYCDYFGGSPWIEASRDALIAARLACDVSQAKVAEARPWVGAAALLRSGWSPGEPLTSAQRLAAAVAVAHRLLAETGADVTIRCDATPAVGAALAGHVTATYTITATGDAP